MSLFDAMTRFDGQIGAGMFWLGTALTYAVMFAVTAWWTGTRMFTDETFGSTPRDQSDMANLSALATLLTFYPSMALIANRVNAINPDLAWMWQIAYPAIAIGSVIAQYRGHMGTPQQPSPTWWFFFLAYVGLMAWLTFGWSSLT